MAAAAAAAVHYVLQDARSVEMSALQAPLARRTPCVWTCSINAAVGALGLHPEASRLKTIEPAAPSMGISPCGPCPTTSKQPLLRTRLSCTRRKALAPPPSERPSVCASLQRDRPFTQCQPDDRPRGSVGARLGALFTAAGVRFFTINLAFRKSHCDSALCRSDCRHRRQMAGQMSDEKRARAQI